jgi:hypothetical protein
MTTGPPGPEFVYAVLVFTLILFALSAVAPHAPLAVVAGVTCVIATVVLFLGYST